MANPLHVGLIGCGRIGANTSSELHDTLPDGWLPYSHAEAIQANEALRLLAICDVKSENLIRTKNAHGVQHCFDNYQTLIDELQIDILAIATRTEGRTDIIRYACENGIKALYLEKPISTNLRDCMFALDSVAKHRVKTAYGVTRRFMEIYCKAKQMVKAGDIGDLIEVCIGFGKSPLLWVHPHSVDTILFFADCIETEYIQADCQITASAIGINRVDEDPVLEFGFIKMSNGVNGIISAQSSVNGMNVTLSGSEGIILIPSNGSWLELQTRKGSGSYGKLDAQKRTVSSEMSGTQRQYHALAQAVSRDLPSPIPAELIEANQKILLGFVKSSLNDGERTRIKDLDPEFTVTGRLGNLFP